MADNEKSATASAKLLTSVENINTGLSLAKEFLGLIAGYYERQAQAAEQTAASTERQLEAGKAMLRLRQTDAQALAALKKDQAHDDDMLAALKAPKTETHTVGGFFHGEDLRRSVTSEVPKTAEENNRINELTETISKRNLEIAQLEQKIASDQMKTADTERSRQERAAAELEKTTAEQKKAADEQAAAQKRENETQQKRAAAQQAADIKAAQLKQDTDKISDLIQMGKDGIAYFDQQIALNDKNPAFSDRERYDNRADYLKEQAYIIADIRAALKDYHPAQAKLDDANKKAIETANDGFQQKGNKIDVDLQPPQTKVQKDAAGLRDLDDPGKHYQSAGDGILGSLRQQASQIGMIGDQISTVFTTVGDKIRTSLGSAFAEAILKGGTFRRTMTNIGQAIVTSFVQSGAQMVANWLWQHTVMAAVSKLFRAQENADHLISETTKTVTTTTAAGIRTTVRTNETLVSTALTTADTAKHGASEVLKTSATLGGSLMRGAIRLGETIFHGIQVVIRTAAHIAGEVAQTAITVAQAPLRIASMLVESGVKLVSAALGAMSAMASIPYVGPFLAIAAMAGILAAGSKLLHREQGGPVSSGQAYIVGEKRPEVFVPNTDGFIVPNVAQVMTRPGYAPAAGGGGGSGSGGTGAGGRPVHVYPLLDNDRAGREAAERHPWSDAHFISMLRKHRRVLGVRV